MDVRTTLRLPEPWTGSIPKRPYAYPTYALTIEWLRAFPSLWTPALESVYDPPPPSLQVHPEWEEWWDKLKAWEKRELEPWCTSGGMPPDVPAGTRRVMRAVEIDLRRLAWELILREVRKALAIAELVPHLNRFREPEALREVLLLSSLPEDLLREIVKSRMWLEREARSPEVQSLRKSLANPRTFLVGPGGKRVQARRPEENLATPLNRDQRPAFFGRLGLSPSWPSAVSKNDFWYVVFIPSVAELRLLLPGDRPQALAVGSAMVRCRYPRRWRDNSARVRELVRSDAPWPRLEDPRPRMPWQSLLKSWAIFRIGTALKKIPRGDWFTSEQLGKLTGMRTELIILLLAELARAGKLEQEGQPFRFRRKTAF